MALKRKGLWTAALVLVGLSVAGIVALTNMSKSTEPGLVVRGVVSDANTGDPIEGAKVSDAGYGPKPYKGAVTDSAGGYRCLTWAEEHALVVEATGYKTQCQTLTVSLFQTERERVLDLALAPQAPSIDPRAPDSPGRLAVIEAFKRRATAVAAVFEAHSYTDSSGKTMPYRLFTPQRLEPGHKYPLVVFLHGAGGSGTDNQKQLQGSNMFGALVWALPENQQRFPSFVVAPQSNVNWPCVILEEGKRPKLCPGLGMGARMAFEIIDKLVVERPIDTKRIYVTGHSMGGAGAWHMISQRPRFFAAAVPVCGLPDFGTASVVKDVPVWNFHGETDEIEPVTTSRRMVEEIVKPGGRPLYTEYPGVGHNVFMWAYTEPALLQWVFTQHR